MRSILLAITTCAALAACTPDIVSGAYLCGPEGACPEGLACNGEDNTCVLPSIAQPFACEPRHEPDDSTDQAFALAPLACVSIPIVDDNCLAAGDPADWVRFSTPASCTAVGTRVRLMYPVAFQRLALQLRDLDADAPVGSDEPCEEGLEDGNERRCLEATLAPGRSYALGVQPAGRDCEGACNYNRYTLSVQLVAP